MSNFPFSFCIDFFSAVERLESTSWIKTFARTAMPSARRRTWSTPGPCTTGSGPVACIQAASVALWRRPVSNFFVHFIVFSMSFSFLISCPCHFLPFIVAPQEGRGGMKLTARSAAAPNVAPPPPWHRTAPAAAVPKPPDMEVPEAAKGEEKPLEKPPEKPLLMTASKSAPPVRHPSLARTTGNEDVNTAEAEDDDYLEKREQLMQLSELAEAKCVSFSIVSFYV